MGTNRELRGGRRRAHEVDAHVGRRIRVRRREQRISQEVLAGRIGLTFQQVQKYERAANRVSASRLFEIARVLDAPVSYFFDGLAQGPEPTGSGQAIRVTQFMALPEADAIVAALLKIRRPGLRRRLAAMVRELAAADAEV